MCERWCVRWCVTSCVWKMNVWQSCVWKMMCDKVVCERRCVRWCVTDDVWQRRQSCVWQSCVWKMMCDKVVCLKEDVWDDVWQSCVWKMMCVCWQSDGGGRRRRGGGEEPGIQNQKQEPHTKMWGIILVKIRLLETIAIIKNNDNNNANKNELVKKWK